MAESLQIFAWYSGIFSGRNLMVFALSDCILKQLCSASPLISHYSIMSSIDSSIQWHLSPCSLSMCGCRSRNDGCRWSTARYAAAAAGGLGGFSFCPSHGAIWPCTASCNARQNRCKHHSHEGHQPAPTNASFPNDDQWWDTCSLQLFKLVYKVLHTEKRWQYIYEISDLNNN